MSHATDSARAWSSHRTLPVSKKLTAFERYAKYNLGLNLDKAEELLASKELRSWAETHCNEHFVPESLLSKWKLTNMWYEGEKKRQPRVSMNDVREHFSEQQSFLEGNT